MSILKRPNSKFWYSEFVLNGKRYIKSTRTTSRTLAAKIDRELYNKAVEESFFGGKTVNFHKAMDMYIHSIRNEPIYNKTYKYIFQWLKENAEDTPVHQIDTAWTHKLAHKRAEAAKPATVRGTLSIVSMTLKYIEKIGYELNPKLDFPTIKVKNEKNRVLTEDEVQAILKELDPTVIRQGIGPRQQERIRDLRDLFITLLETGMRVNEASTLKWSDVDFEKKIVSVWREKTSSASVLPISNKLMEVLAERNRSTEYVFPNDKGDGPRPYSWRTFHNACERAGCPDISFHTLRHSAITRMAKAGLSLPKLMKFSGHTETRTLSRYTHLTNMDVVEDIRSILDK